jgi:hypothetical protein
MSRLPFPSAVATGRGDDGTTGLLFDDVRVQKDDLRAEAFGTIDEAVAALGVARAELGAAEPQAGAERSPAFDALADREDLPPAAIADTLEGLAGSFADKAVAVAAYLRTLEAEASAIADARSAMERRETALRHHADRLRAYLKAEMERTGLTRVAHPWLALRVQANPPAVVVEDEGMLPARFKEAVTTVKVLKTEIGKALKAGETVFGAHLEQTTRLVIR